MRGLERAVIVRRTGDDEGHAVGIALLALGAAFLAVMLPGLANVIWPESRVVDDPAPLARVVSEPRSFEAVWANAHPSLSSLHPPPATEPEQVAAAEPVPPAAAVRRRVATAAIPRPPERPAAPVTEVAEAPAPAEPRRQERPRVLGLDVPTLDDAARLLDNAASLAGSVTRYLPRI